jgi:hypothetical protein
MKSMSIKTTDSGVKYIEQKLKAAGLPSWSMCAHMGMGLYRMHFLSEESYKHALQE